MRAGANNSILAILPVLAGIRRCVLTQAGAQRRSRSIGNSGLRAGTLPGPLSRFYGHLPAPSGHTRDPTGPNLDLFRTCP